MTSAVLPLAVIGAGFSGTMAALHLLPALESRPILLCEGGARFARGIAYGTDDPGHLLNVRAGNMSAYPVRPDHFLDWLRSATPVAPEQVHDTAAGTFVSRHLYGSYLTGLLNEAVTRPDGATRLILIADEVVDLVPEEGAYRLVLAGGNSHRVAGVVLAVGNLPPGATNSGLYVADPWAVPFAENLNGGEPVVVIGTGLTMVDIALHLQRAQFTGPLIAVSRRGLRSHVHAATVRWPTPKLTDRERASPARLLRRIRCEAAEASRVGASWRSVVDSLRPITSDLWRGLRSDKQDTFLRHARPWWDIHRHRMAPPVGEKLDAMIASGFLTIRAAHVVEVAIESDRAAVVLRPRGGAGTETIVAQRVINAAGGIGVDRCGNPLIDRLIARGLVRLGRHKLGLDQADDLALLGTSGAPTPRLWALGPLGAGAFWECVAVPDIRQQAARVAERIAAALGGQVNALGRPSAMTCSRSLNDQSGPHSGRSEAETRNREPRR